jgi:hypothetical protein
MTFIKKTFHAYKPVSGNLIIYEHIQMKELTILV